MRFFLMLGCSGIVAAGAVAQVKDTVRNDYDYRKSAPVDDYGTNTDKPNVRHNHYLGLQANQLLSQILDFDGEGDVNNPFVLTYSFNSLTRGSGMSFGLGYLASTKEDFDTGAKRTTKTNNINFRFGYERKTRFAKRWWLGRGIDFLVKYQKDETNNSNGNFGIKNTGNGWGIGPRMSILFGLSENVFLGTEMSWYFQRLKMKTEFPGAPISDSDLIESSFNLQMPVAIFLTMKF